MKSISLKELKLDLSSWTAIAAAGTLLQVTRYNKPYIYLFGSDVPGLHIGRDAGQRELKSALRKGTNGRALELLAQDRHD